DVSRMASMVYWVALRLRVLHTRRRTVGRSLRGQLSAPASRRDAATLPRLNGDRLPPLPPPLLEAPALLRQSALVEAQQRLDPRLDALPRRRPALQLPADLGQPAAGDVTIVRPAQDLLHLLDARVEVVLEPRREAVGEHLHRVAQPLSGDAHLVQLLVAL